MAGPDHQPLRCMLAAHPDLEIIRRRAHPADVPDQRARPAIASVSASMQPANTKAISPRSSAPSPMAATIHRQRLLIACCMFKSSEFKCIMPQKPFIRITYFCRKIPFHFVVAEIADHPY